MSTTLSSSQVTSDFGAFSNGSWIYLGGGFDANYVATNRLFRIDATVLNTLRIQEVSTMLSTRAAFKAVNDGAGNVCVAGGYTDENGYCPGLTTVECYSLANDLWSTRAPLTTPRAYVGLGAINGQLIVVGGEESKASDCGIFFPDPSVPLATVVDTVQVLDGNSWVPAPAPLAARSRFGDSVTVDADTEKKAYFFGGQGTYDAGCQCYKTTDNVMVVTLGATVLPTPPPTPRPVTAKPTAPPTSPPVGKTTGPAIGFGCFSGEAMVTVKEEGPLPMKDLRIGHSIMVADNTFSEVYSFGHYDQAASTVYLSIDAGLEKPLVITADHMVFVEANKPVPASMIRVGDNLMLVDGFAVVKSIRQVVRTGAFAPFTKDGTIVVDSIVASSYVSLQPNSASLVIGGVDTFGMHSVAHLFQAPHRLVCKLNAAACASETYNNGLSVWIEAPLRLFQWLFQQHPALVVMMLLPMVAIVLVAAAVEGIVSSPILLLVALTVGGLWCSRSRKRVR